MTDYTDQLQNTANQILQGAIDAATKGGEFLKEQIPDVLLQLLAWNLSQDAFFIAITPLVLWASYRWLTKWSSQEPDCIGDWGVAKTMAGAVGGIASIIAVVSFICSALDAIKIMVAPKVWLLEYASALIRHH